MTISSESCPICGLNCEADVKRVWPNAVYVSVILGEWQAQIWRERDSSGDGDDLISFAWTEEKAWHNAAQRPEVKAVTVRRDSTCAHCSRDMRVKPYEQCSNGGVCLSITAFDAKYASDPEFAALIDAERKQPEAMREAGKAAESRCEAVHFGEHCINHCCLLEWGHSTKHKDGDFEWGDDSEGYAPAPVEAGPQHGGSPMTLREIMEAESPAAERGEPKGVEDLLLHINGIMPTSDDWTVPGLSVWQINRRIREAEKIGEARGFNACREMAAKQIVGFVDTSMVLSAVTAMRNLKSEGK